MFLICLSVGCMGRHANRELVVVMGSLIKMLEGYPWYENISMCVFSHFQPSLNFVIMLLVFFWEMKACMYAF